MNQIRSGSRATVWVIAAVAIGTAFLMGTTMLGGGQGSMALLTAAVAAASISATTQVARWWVAARTVAAEQRRKRALIVGAGPVAQHLAREAELQGYEVLGFVADIAELPAGEHPSGIIGPRGALADLARDLEVNQILVTDAPSRVWPILEQLERQEIPAELYVVPDSYELALGRPSSVRIGDVALFRLPRRQASVVYRYAKRAIDVTVAVGLLVLCAPFLLLAMLAIQLSSPGPALFRQERIGKNGKRFEIIKLRTMVVDAEKDGPRLCAGKADPRLTPVGKFLRRTHLDEFPQLWNVLRGEMSLVGPRPERAVFVEQFERELPRYGERHRVLPGITGLAQVQGYYHSSPREKLRFDLMYVYHPSLWLDLCIIVRTALSVFD